VKVGGFKVPPALAQIVGIHCRKTSVDNFVKIKTGNWWINIKFVEQKILSDES
jgi:hypothetical protein